MSGMYDSIRMPEVPDEQACARHCKPEKDWKDDHRTDKNKAGNNKVGKVRTGKDRVLWTVVILTVDFLAAGIVSYSYFAGYHVRYRAFIKELSVSTTYASENRSLRADADGEVVRVAKHNMENLFKYIRVSDIGQEQREIPEKTADVRLDYGDGATLALWDLMPEEGARSRRLFLYFEKDDMKYGYISDKMNMETIKMRYIDDIKNIPWTD